MGHREDLLAGAKRCLYQKGYARITARDIVEASNTNLASIGYHFGSKEALLHAAMMEVLQDLGEQLDTAYPPDDEPLKEQLGGAWEMMTQELGEHRPVWSASVEAYIQAQYAPTLRAELVPYLRKIRQAMGSELQKANPELDDRAAWAAGSAQLALLTGLMLQWIVDPEMSLSGEDLVTALRTLGE
ncbi:TetR/AcrR family transcriptional regulator [Streptomyces sp. DSM 44915]|uniref:TetR/AcrR family transcriptional regulator n=1 Tax=Streptomyces chisholmiae TaxID=3075540 RepID=A0ABU2JSU8_9ACTN|nr:TetR/AcrR family transcriptional regulator [Streptomyces sp. DSM 44915]MDT0268065.1 TetR/AcrR family transcriptional regulator [Streptomyces sp. DSM 44915]